MEVQVVVAAVVLLIATVIPTTSRFGGCARGCRRGGRSLLMQPRNAQEAILSFKNDFDMNVDFQLRKIGIVDPAASGKNSNVYFHIFLKELLQICPGILMR